MWERSDESVSLPERGLEPLHLCRENLNIGCLSGLLRGSGEVMLGEGFGPQERHSWGSHAGFGAEVNGITSNRERFLLVLAPGTSSGHNVFP